MKKKVVVKDCDDCQFHEAHYANGKLMDQYCHKLGVQIHRNIQMDFPNNCPLEDDIVTGSQGHDVKEFYEDN